MNSLRCILPLTALAGWLGVDALVAADLPAKPVRVDAAEYPTLQAAVDALPPAGGLVILPPGEFRLREPLVIRTGDTRIEGAGAATHLRNDNTNGQPAIVIRPKEIAQKPRERLWRVQLGNFRVSGNTNSGDGIFAHGVNEVFLHGLSVDHHGGDGVKLQDCYEDPRIADSIFTYNAKAGVHIIGGHDIVVNANHFEENLDALRCVDGFNLCFNGNNVDDHLRHGVVVENTYGSVLSGNMIEECNGTAVLLDRDCYGITVSANVIAHHLGGGVHLLDAWGCTVSANNFVLVHSNAVLVAASGRHTITGNNFVNSHIGAGQTKRPAEHKDAMGRDEATGIRLVAATDIVISGNQFSGLSGPAVQAEGAGRRLLVTGNVVTDHGRRQSAKGSAIDLGPATGSLVKDNLVDP